MSRYLAAFFLVLLISFSANAEIYEVTTKQAEQKVGEMLVKAGEGEKFRVRFFGINQDKLFLSGLPLAFDVANFDYDKKRGMFKATINYKNGEQQVGAREVSGRFEEIAMVPVLKKGVARGTVISEEDMDFTEQPVTRMAGDMIRAPEDIIGKSAARFISEGRPLRQSDVKDPAVLKKGELVTMIYRKGVIEIKTQGVALEDAAVGHTTQVKNPKSGAVLQAKVESNGIVIIEGLKDEPEESIKQEKVSSSGGKQNADVH